MEYYCKNCNKKYASYKSLWFHNYKFHKDDVTLDVTDVTENSKKNSKKSENIKKNRKNVTKNVTKCNNFVCNNCNSSFNNRQSKWRHEKNCNETIQIKDDKSKDETILEMKKEMDEYKAEMTKLKDMLQKALKIHPKTLQKINNQLNNTNNGTINNNTVIIQLGKEDLTKMLTMDEKMSILNRQAMGINDLVKLVHTSGKYKKCMNVYITNLQNTIGYMYDEKQNNYIADNKNKLLND